MGRVDVEDTIGDEAQDDDSKPIHEDCKETVRDGDREEEGTDTSSQRDGSALHGYRTWK